MNPQAFLLACADLETEIGDLYRRLSQRLDPSCEAAALFLELAEQENVHAKSLHLVARLMRGVKEGTTVLGDAGRVVQTMKQGLGRATAILEGGRPVTPEDALSVAIRIESSALEAHSPRFLETDSDELRSTIRMLATDTDRHKARLEKLLHRTRGA